MSGFVSEGDQRNRGEMRRASSPDVTLTLADTYYKITGIFSDSGLNHKFTTSATGEITYNGVPKSFLLNGVSDVKVDKACQLTYALYKNGSLVSGAETPHGFTAASKTENISIISLLGIVSGDYYEVFAKSNVATTVLSPDSLILTFVEA